RLVDVVQWGTSNWNSMESAFYGAANLKVSATDSPNLTEVGTMGNMFRGCASVTTIPNINLWNTSNVSDMEGLFKDAEVFNQPLNWDIAKVTSVKYMFSGAKVFNQDLSALSWNHTVNLTGFLNYCGFSCKNTKKLVNTFEKKPVRDPNLGLPNLFSGNSIDARDWLNNMRIDYEASTVECGDETYANHFVTQWDLSRAGSAGNNSISFFAIVSALTKYTWVYMGRRTEGFISPYEPNVTIGGLPAGATIELFIASPHLKQFAIANNADKARLVDVVQWGTSEWDNMELAFQGASNLTISATDVPDLAGVESMRAMFNHCSILNGPANIGAWNTANVTNMRSMFSGATAFNHSLNTWNTANVTDMSAMFYKAEVFNKSLNAWNTANVNNMKSMFTYARSFDEPLDKWITEKVTNMLGMFAYAESFNQNLNDWKTGAVTNMAGMFAYAESFNQDLKGWKTGAVTNMSKMFAFAESFDRPLNDWKTANVTDMSGMFDGAEVFDQPLNNWNTEKVTDMSGMFQNAESFDQDLSNWVLNENVSLDKFLLSIDLKAFSNCASSKTGRSGLSLGMFFNQNSI
ncbi:MAG: BspA family leucine-rich repeat surface protein, partial [Pedobacter sp.]